MTDGKGAGEGPYKIGIPDEYIGTTDYVSHRLVGPGLGRWGAPDVSDLMPDEGHLALLVDAANAIYAAGRKAERERCAKIAEGYFNARGRVVAKAIMGDMMQSEIDKRPYVHECGKTNYIFCPACVYAEGRKAAEKDFDRFFRLEEGAGD